jgi:hypothetical protein
VKKEARLLKSKVVDALILLVETFKRPMIGDARIACSVICLTPSRCDEGCHHRARRPNPRPAINTANHRL